METITLKEFKRKIKEAGFRFKTEIIGNHRHLEILDTNKHFICGSGANVYYQNTIDKYPEAFKLINTYKNRVYDEEGDKVIF